MGEFLKLNRNIQLRILMMLITVAIGSSVGPNMTIYYIEYFGPLVIGILLIIVQLSGFLAGLYGGHLSDL
ncbi:hypothetical protein [Leuconostoc palmae]|uniref:hypothetical protein n=1 Tax=Leuconostoc palmae TaxID=501487 RepID=UPI001FE78DED|nr:hypothetical protein [Leuconostoc palmae]